MSYVLFAVWSLACVGAGMAAIIGLGMMIDKRRPRPTRRAAPVTAETAMRLWTPTASGGYRLAYVEDGQPVGLISDPDTEWTVVPARPRDIYIVEAGATQYQG